MTALTVSKARDDFAEVINRVAYQGQRITLQRRGKEVVAIVPLEDMGILEAIEDHLDIEAAREALKEPGVTPWKEVKKNLGL